MNLTARKEAKEQGLKRYFTGEPCRNEHVSERLSTDGRCTQCKSNCDAKYNEENKSKIKTQKQRFYQNNKEEIKARVKSNYYKNPEVRIAYNDKNKVKIKEVRTKYYHENKSYFKEHKSTPEQMEKSRVRARKKRIYMIEEIGIENVRRIENEKKRGQEVSLHVKTSRMEYWRERRRTDPDHMMLCSCRQMLRRCLDSTGEKKNNRTEQILKYTKSELKSHIESQFVDGMTWDNRSEWHIDHIKPISLFIKEGETNPAIINALSNLQPLWAKDNLLKGASY